MKSIAIAVLGLFAWNAQADHNHDHFEKIHLAMADGRFVYNDHHGEPIDDQLSDDEKSMAQIQACNVFFNMGNVTIGDVGEDADVSITINVKPEAIDQECKNIKMHTETSTAGGSSWSSSEEPPSNNYGLN